MVHLQKPSIYWVLHCPKQCNASELGRSILEEHCNYRFYSIVKPNTSNLLIAARKISGDGLPAFTSGSSPMTTWCIRENNSWWFCLQCKMTFMGSVGHKKRTYHSYILLQKSTMSSAERVVYKTKIKWVRKCKDTPCCNSHWYSIGMKMMDQT